MSVAPDEIVTDRLVLRRPVESDLDDLAELWSDPQVLRHIGKPASREEAWARLLKYAGHWSLFGFGYWMIREAASGQFVGEGGVAYQRRTGRAFFGDEPEAGWMIAGAAQGRGYAAEAMNAILDWSDGQPWHRTTCLVGPANVPSVRLAKRLGFVSVGTAELAGAELTFFERARR